MIKPPRTFRVSDMPRVDVHTHMRNSPDMGRFLRAMTRAGISISINLSPPEEMIVDCGTYHLRSKGRILQAPGTYWIHKGLGWSKKDLATFKASGCVGTKILSKYQPGLNRKAIVSKIDYQEEIGGLPLWLHIVDPPRPGLWQPTFWERVYEAEELISAHPNMPIIMAHGFWLMIDDRGLDVLAGFFDRYSHLHVDLSAVFQWWDPPEPSYQKLRDFIITYKDRILYGTDANPNYSKKMYYDNSFSIMETRGHRLNGFFGWERKTYIRGLGLSKEVLNYIYWWNAARIIPRVKESLESLGVHI